MTKIIQIVPQKIGDGNSQTVSARDLHKFLGVKKKFADWIKDQIKRGLFDENIDYIIVQEVFPLKGKNLNLGGRPSIEYFLTVETAKLIAFISETEKGKEVKNYFLKIEQEYCDLKIQQAIQEAVEKAIERERQKENPKLELIKVRGNGKIILRSFTDMIKAFITYAKLQGSQNADRYYLIFTIEIYRSLGLIKTNKDFGKLKNAISEIKLNDEDLKN